MTAICPVRALQSYLAVRSTSGVTFFCHFDGSPLTKGQIRAVLEKAINFCGWNGVRVKSHSFRIGAASRAAELGFTDERIMQMGRWKSGAFRAYIRLPQSVM